MWEFSEILVYNKMNLIKIIKYFILKTYMRKIVTLKCWEKGNLEWISNYKKQPPAFELNPEMTNMLCSYGFISAYMLRWKWRCILIKLHRAHTGIPSGCYYTIMNVHNSKHIMMCLENSYRMTVVFCFVFVIFKDIW